MHCERSTHMKSTHPTFLACFSYISEGAVYRASEWSAGNTHHPLALMPCEDTIASLTKQLACCLYIWQGAVILSSERLVWSAIYPHTILHRERSTRVYNAQPALPMRFSCTSECVVHPDSEWVAGNTLHSLALIPCEGTITSPARQPLGYLCIWQGLAILPSERWVWSAIDSFTILHSDRSKRLTIGRLSFTYMFSLHLWKCCPPL